MWPYILAAIVAAVWLLGSATNAGAPVNKVRQFAEAIAYAEGFWDRQRNIRSATRPARNNNPGDIEGKGDTGQSDGVYAIFSTLAEGWKRLFNQVSFDLNGKSAL